MFVKASVCGTHEGDMSQALVLRVKPRAFYTWLPAHTFIHAILNLNYDSWRLFGMWWLFGIGTGLSIVAVVWQAYARIRRERRQFRTAITRSPIEITPFIVGGLMGSILLSIISVSLALFLPTNTLVALGVISLLGLVVSRWHFSVLWLGLSVIPMLAAGTWQLAALLTAMWLLTALLLQIFSRSGRFTDDQEDAAGQDYRAVFIRPVLLVATDCACTRPLVCGDELVANHWRGQHELRSALLATGVGQRVCCPASIT